jgi:hypothetical protein
MPQFKIFIFNKNFNKENFCILIMIHFQFENILQQDLKKTINAMFHACQLSSFARSFPT